MKQPSLSALRRIAGEMSTIIDMATAEERETIWFACARRLERDIRERISERAKEDDDYEQAY